MTILSAQPSFWSSSRASSPGAAAPNASPRSSVAVCSADGLQSAAVSRASIAVRWIGLLFVLTLAALTSACGSSSRSFGDIGTGTTTPATVTAISVEPTNTSLPRGLTRQFTAIALYSDGTKLDVSSSVTWSSSAANNAPINATGVLTALNLGPTTVAATIGTVTGSTTLTVSAATLVSINVTPVSPTIAKGTLQLLTATGIYTDNSVQDVSAAVTWSSSNPLVATISNAPGSMGLATGVSGGVSTMTATLGAATGSTPLTVSGATLLSISVTPATASIPLGAQRQFIATGLYSDNTQLPLTNSVTWSSSSTIVATISNATGFQGLATAAAVGVTTISATAGGLTGTATLTVTAASLVSIAVTPANPSIPKGLTQTFVATGTFSDGTTQNLTATAVWNSATPGVATITNAPQAAGVATGVTAGTSVITATQGAIVSAPTTLTVSPAQLLSIAVTPVNPTVVNGATLQFTATGTYTDGTTPNITTAVTWSSATPTVAVISNVAGPPNTQGLATAAAPGTTLITAAFPGTTITSPPQTLTVKSAYAYATNTGVPAALGTISQYSIGIDGALTMLTPATVDADINAFSIALNPAGTYAYVANYDKAAASGSISQYAVSQVTGVLTPNGAPVATVSNPNSVTIDPSGRYVYVSNTNENSVSQFVIQADGTLANPPGTVGIGGAIYGSGSGPSSIAINTAGTFAYVANYNDGTVWQYAILAAPMAPLPAGALVPIPGEPASVAAQLNSSYVVVDPTGRYVYVTNQNAGAGTISEYSIGGDGSLTLIGTTPVATTGNGPSFIAINTQGTYAYVADSNSDDVSQYAITNGGVNAGQLTLVATFPTGAGSVPYGVTIDATGRWLYVAERIAPGVISQFAISPVDGTLTPLAPPTAPAGADPTSIVTTH